MQIYNNINCEYNKLHILIQMENFNASPFVIALTLLGEK